MLAIIGLGVYAYFTTPLPFGLSSVVHTPGGANVPPPSSTGGAPAGTRTAAGQPLGLGVVNVVVENVQRNQDLSAAAHGPPGSFTLVTIQVQNNGNEPLMTVPADFRLVDERGRVYAVDLDATSAASTAARHRVIFDASVPPAGQTVTVLAFETAPDINALTMRVTLGYGELELPH